MSTKRDIKKLEKELQKTYNRIEKKLAKEETPKLTLLDRIKNYLNNRKIKRKKAELEEVNKLLAVMSEEISGPKNHLNNVNIFTENDNSSTEIMTTTKPKIDVIAELKKPIRLCLPNYEISITQY